MEWKKRGGGLGPRLRRGGLTASEGRQRGGTGKRAEEVASVHILSYGKDVIREEASAILEF